MLPGVKLLWDLVNAMIEVHRAAAWRLWDIPSMGLWLLFAMVFLLPGWILATMRRTVVIDPGHAVALQVNDFVIYRWSSSTPLSAFDSVRLFIPPPSSSSSSRARVAHHVTLSGSDRKKLIVYLEEDEDVARAVARDVAAFCALPLRDEVKHDTASEAESREDEDVVG